jgi:hypothetical protein
MTAPDRHKAQPMPSLLKAEKGPMVASLSVEMTLAMVFDFDRQG